MAARLCWLLPLRRAASSAPLPMRGIGPYAVPYPSVLHRGRPALAEPLLSVERVSHSFGGLLAVNGASLSAPAGRITGLIGPNGAGKTTLFNVASGLVRPAAGSLRLHGADMSGLDPAARARRGLGRTFQKMELFESLTVRENVSLGREAAQAGLRPWRHVAETTRDRQSRRAAAEQAMA